jgi:ABC-type lipoprotein export system ATPase subunit
MCLEKKRLADLLKIEIIKLSSIVHCTEVWDKENQEFLSWQSRARLTLETAEARYLNLATVNQPKESKDELADIVSCYDIVRNAYVNKDSELATLRNEKSHNLGKISSLEEQLIELRQLLYLNTTTEAQAVIAGHEVKRIQGLYAARFGVVYKLDLLSKTIQDDEKALQKAQNEERTAGRLRRVMSHLDEVRDVFKLLPQVAAQACLDSITFDINDVLDKFDAPFRVQSVDNLRFTLKKHSGVLTPAERLSGGEKAVFALAFRIAVNSKFAGQLGLLCLDEPTAGLDEDNLGCLEVALERLRELSTSRGLQVVLITHENGLDGLFDRVIKLSAVR